MKKKVILIVVLVVCVLCIGLFAFNKSKQQKSTTSSMNGTNSQFRVKAAFADIDTDMIIQDADLKDDDPNADYVFITFTNAVSDTKKSDSTNPFNIKNYKLDGKNLPDKSKVVQEKDYNYKVTIVLPNGYLKGANSNHSLEISKDLKSKNGLNITGDLSLKLPYSKSEDSTSTKTESKNTKDTSNSTKSSNSSNGSSNSAKPVTSEEKAAIAKNNENMPKYTVEIMKTIPMTTIILVKLDTPTPENYKVSITGVNLQIKTNKEGKKVFVNSVDKEYELDEVKQLIKIEKVNQK
ncbi:hypothetical protein HBE96_21000 [Clostridium sp. P21]|uniref:Membrane-associated protein n=1 Tax=Clostridium muellerianum TaxID=2716538 RepID=A0A7Y0EMB5_9CLOT|nr:hypothetical protein [Clostridium muellerianum]NMM65065.1 hypothetical protein [Clostridium muellerianum]